MKLKKTTVIGDAIEDRESGWQGHIEFVDWIDEEHILYCNQSGWVTCRHLESQTDLWKHQIEFKYAKFSLCRDKRVFAMLVSLRTPEVSKDQIAIIDCDSCEFLAKWDGSALSDLLDADHALPTNIALAPVSGKLFVILFSRTFGSNGFIVGSDYKRVEGRFEADHYVHDISVSPSEDRVAMRADKSLVSVLDLPANDWLYLEGDRIYKERLSEEGDTGPGISQVFHDGQDLLVIGHDGLNGTIYVHSLLNGTVEEFGGTSFHDRRDVDFKNQRIAITGLGKDVSIRSFDGKELAYLPDVTLQQNSCIKLSPLLERLVVGSWDNTVSIYEISLEEDPNGPSWYRNFDADIEVE